MWFISQPKFHDFLRLFFFHTTEEASSDLTIPGDGGRWKPVGRRLLDRVRLWLIDRSDKEALLFVANEANAWEM